MATPTKKLTKKLTISRGRITRKIDAKQPALGSDLDQLKTELTEYFEKKITPLEEEIQSLKEALSSKKPNSLSLTSKRDKEEPKIESNERVIEIEQIQKMNLAELNQLATDLGISNSRINHSPRLLINEILNVIKTSQIIE